MDINNTAPSNESETYCATRPCPLPFSPFANWNITAWSLDNWTKKEVAPIYPSKVPFYVEQSTSPFGRRCYLSNEACCAEQPCSLDVLKQKLNRLSFFFSSFLAVLQFRYSAKKKND